MESLNLNKRWSSDKSHKQSFDKIKEKSLNKFLRIFLLFSTFHSQSMQEGSKCRSQLDEEHNKDYCLPMGEM